MKRIFVALLLAAAQSPAWAQCVTYPNTLTNGTVANADQVMANFNCAMPTGGGTFTGPVAISSSSGVVLDAAAIGRFVSPNSGSTGGVIIRDQPGDPDANYLQFVNNANNAQYVALRGMKANGLQVTNRLGVNGFSTSYTFYVAGNSAGLSSWANVSDGRLKKNVTQISGALDTVLKLRGVRYAWKTPAEQTVFGEKRAFDATPQVGFIAQEVAQVIPEAVNVPASPNEPYSLKPTEIIPFLVEAIRELQAHVKTLSDQVATLSK